MILISHYIIAKLLPLLLRSPILNCYIVLQCFPTYTYNQVFVLFSRDLSSPQSYSKTIFCGKP